MNRIDPSLLDAIVCCDCLDGMRTLPDDCIPLTVTSPPYDDRRAYGDHRWDFEVFTEVAGRLYRLTEPGGVVVRVVQDGTEDGSHTGTSARRWLRFREIGFNLDTMLILACNGWRAQRRRCANQFHYGFVLGKGAPRTYNSIRDRPNSTAGRRLRSSRRDRGGRAVTTYNASNHGLGEDGYRTNIWYFDVGWGKTTQDWYVYDCHPALMSEDMASDLIMSYSRPGELVFDPTAGAAATCKMAMLNNRRYLGFEVHPPYHMAAMRRLGKAREKYQGRLDDWLFDDLARDDGIDARDTRTVLAGA